MLEFEGLLDRLEAFDPEGAEVLSVYLLTAPRPCTGPNARAPLANVLRPLRAAIQDADERKQLMDKARARIFQVCMGEIEELDSFADDVPGKHREGRSLQRAYQGPAVGVVGMGYDSSTIQRHHAWHARQRAGVSRRLEARRRTTLGLPMAWLSPLPGGPCPPRPDRDRAGRLAIRRAGLPLERPSARSMPSLLGGSRLHAGAHIPQGLPGCGSQRRAP